MSRNTISPEEIDISYEQTEITTIKKLKSQMENLMLRNKNLLSVAQHNRLSKTVDTLSSLEKKKSTLIKKRQVYDEKLAKLTSKLQEQMENLSQKEQLAVILAFNFNTFSFGTDTLKKGMEEFLFSAPKVILQRKTTPKKFVKQLLEKTRDTTHTNYPIFFEKYKTLCREFGLD